MLEFKPLFKNIQFMSLWVSQILSQITVQMMNFLLLAQLFTKTGSTIATSLLWVSYSLPAIFFGPIGAASVDLISRRKMLMATNFLQALTVFVYIFTHQISIFLLYIVVMVYSFFNQFYVPAESASLPSIVSKKLLPQANSLFFLTQQISLVVGLSLAGIMHKLFGFSGSLIACTIFLFVAFVSVSFLSEMKPRTKIPEKFDKLIITFFKSMLEGYYFIKNKKFILYPLLLLLGIQVALAIMFVNLPIIAKETLMVPVNFAGVLVVIPAGIGATIGSLLVTKYVGKKIRKKTIIEISLLILSISMSFIIFLIPHLPGLSRLIIAPILIILVGGAFIGINIPSLTYLQEVTPEWLRGRVFGNMWFLITIATIFPVVFSGVITEFFGIKILITLMLIGVITVYLYSKKRGQLMIEESFE